MKGEECCWNRQETFVPSILLSDTSPGSYCPVFRNQDWDLWLQHSRKGLVCTHCPIGFGYSETSPVTRQKMSYQVEGDKQEALQQEWDGGCAWEKRK